MITGALKKIQGISYLNDAGSFMSQGHISMSVMLVGATKSRMCNFNEDFVWPYLPGCGSLDNFALLGAFEDGEINHIEEWLFFVERNLVMWSVKCEEWSMQCAVSNGYVVAIDDETEWMREDMTEHLVPYIETISQAFSLPHEASVKATRRFLSRLHNVPSLLSSWSIAWGKIPGR